jgi:hypothetical protein
MFDETMRLNRSEKSDERLMPEYAQGDLQLRPDNTVSL